MNAREIAAKLSKARREFVLMPLYSATSEGISSAWFHDTGYGPARAVAKLGLATRRQIEPGWTASIPTPLGLEVRAILQEQSK